MAQMQPQVNVYVVNYVDVNDVKRIAPYAFFEEKDAQRYVKEKKDLGAFKEANITECMLSGIQKNPAYRLWTLITRGEEIEDGELYE
jgi:hypothetical protein